LQFDQGDLFFNFIEFEGDREAGNDILFTSRYENGVEADLDARFTSERISFDIPQGVYERIRISIGNDIETVEPSIILEGAYNSAKDGDIALRIEFDMDSPIELNGIPGNGSEIVLNRDIPNLVEILFDPPELFPLSTSRQLESATIEVVDGESIIIISKTTNTVIFNTITNRLERSISAIFK